MLIPVSQLKLPPNALRNIKNNSLAFLQMEESIKNEGVLSPLTVYKKNDYYEIIDGSIRYVILVRLNIPEVECIVTVPKDKKDTIKKKLIVNNHYIAPERSDIKFMLERIVIDDPNITLPQICRDLAIEANVVLNHFKLKLRILSKEILGKLYSGQLTVANAILLARIPTDDQIKFLEDAMTTQYLEFKELTLELLRCNITKRTTKPILRRPAHKLKTLNQIRNELERLTIFNKYVELGNIVDARSAYKAFGAWVIGEDPSIFK